MTALTHEAWTTEDGLLWGAFVYGHHDLDLVRSEPVFEMLVAHVQTACMIEEHEAREYLQGREPAQHWIRDVHLAEEIGDPERPWRYCGAEAPGAVAITGWRFI